MGTGGPPYTNPLRPKITIQTVDGVDDLYTYNAFNSSNPISIRNLTTDNAVGETGTFSMLINDHNNQIPKDNIHNVKVKIELGKKSDWLNPFLIGYGDLFSIDRPGTAAQFYNLSGFGSKIWAYQLYIHRHERYEKGSGDARIHNIVENAFTKRLWRPLKKQDESIENITGWDGSGISSTINTPYSVINETFVYFGDFLDKLADITGAVWFIDYSGGEEVLTFKNKSKLMTKALIKSGDLADRTNDRADRISYIVSAFGIVDDSTNSAGFANRLFSTTFQDSVEMWPLDAVNYAKSSNSINNKALGQQVIIDNDARRIKMIELHLRKIGEPVSPNSRVNGGIFMDKSNKPNMTFTLDTFKIDLSSIEEQGKHIQVPVDISPDKLDNAQSKIWVVLFQRSGDGKDSEGNDDGTSGDPQDDPNNTIVWGHNNVFNTAQVIQGQTIFSGQAPGGDFGSKSKLSWQTVSTGPTYSVRVYSDIRRLFARSNGRSKREDRLREVYVPTDFLKDPGDVSRFLSLNLADTSKGRRAIAEFRVTVPDDFLFRPYQQVSFHDGLSDIDEVLQVQRASYTCDGGTTDDAPLGTLYCNLSLLGSYNTLVGACQCN
jgi:hypothetical protein